MTKEWRNDELANAVAFTFLEQENDVYFDWI
jgi:hypothetical protein